MVTTMKTFARTLLGLTLLLPLSACPSDDGPTEQPDAGPRVDATPALVDGGPLPPPEFTACEADVDEGKDGSIDGLWTFTYKDGIFLNDSLDQGLDGVVDQNIDYVFENGFMKRFAYSELDETGTLKLTFVEEYVRDAQGRLRTILTDVDGDGVIDRRRSNLLDAVGRVTEVHIDLGNDSTLDDLHKNTYVDGVLAYTEIDTGNDGIIDSKIIFVRNDESQVVRKERDDGVDGTINRLETTSYESHGWIEHTTDDAGNDGLIEREYFYTYENNLMDTMSYVIRAQGLADFVELQTYRYGCEGDKPQARQDRARIAAEIREAMHGNRR
jgi:hypothetical protein